MRVCSIGNSMNKSKVKSQKSKVTNRGFTRTLIVALFRFWQATASGIKNYNKNVYFFIKYGETKKAMPQLVCGFILSLAVLLSAIILSIGLSVFNIISKEILLASSGRESHFAFYAADTAVECALFWDVKQGIFPTSSDSLVYGTGGGLASCDGVSIIPFTSSAGTPTAATSTFSLNGTHYCAKVTVAKFPNGTTIEAKGYNTCVTSDPIRLERAIRLSY